MSCQIIKDRFSHARYLLQLMRLRVTLLAPVLTLVGWRSAHVTRAPHFDVVSSMLACFTLIASGQVFNDVVDRELDAMAKPSRPIPSGHVSINEARALAIILAASSLAVAAITSTATLLLCILCLLLEFSYSAYLKNTVLIGNVVVALTCSLAVPFGSVSVHLPGAREVLAEELVFFFLMGNEIFKTGVDMNEDGQYGLITLATTRGLRMTAISAAVCAALMACGDVVSFMFGLSSLLFAGLFFLGTVIPATIGAGIAMLGRYPDQAISNGLKWWSMGWVPGILTLLIL